LLRRTGTFLAGLSIGILAIGTIWIFLSEPRGKPIELHPPATPGPLRVHVSGAVMHPGVYLLPSDSIVLHAVEAAGGAKEGAVLDVINLAASLEEGQQIYVPSVDETKPVSPMVLSITESNTGEKVNINEASAPELERLPGIGPSLAQKIVDYRTANGPFLSPEDLLKVSGIGPSKLDQIRGSITLR
jgi:competence protein ComEA